MAPLVSSLFSSAVEGIGTWPVLAGAVVVIVLVVVIALCLGHGGSTKRNGNDITGKNGEQTNSVAINHRNKLDEPGAISYENNTATDRAPNAGRKQQTSSGVLSGGDGVQHSIGNKSISASVPALYTNPNSMMVTLSGSRQFGHGLNVATSSDGSGGVVVNSIDKNGSESASNNVARGSRIVSLTVLFDKDTDINDVRKLLHCVAPYQIRLEVDTTGSQSDVKSTTVQVLRHDDASVEHEGQRRTVSLDGPAFHSNIAGDLGRGGMVMRGLPEADIDLPDGRTTLGINPELDDDALAAALNEIEAINIRDGELRLQDGRGSEEDVFELAVGTRASAPEVAVIHGGDLVVEETTVGTLDAGGSFSFDGVVIDAPEAFGMRGDTDVLRSEPTSGYVHFTAASPKIASEQAGTFEDSALTKHNGEVAAEVSISDDVQPLQQLPEADTTVGEIDTVATELDQFVPDADSVSTNVSRESFNVELPADYAPVVRATSGRTEETVGAKSSDNPALEIISAPEIKNNVELSVEVRGVEQPTSSNNGTKKRPTVMSTLGRFGVIDITQTEAADPISSGEVDVEVAPPITETSSLHMESVQVDVSAGQSTEGLIITDEAETQLPTTDLAVSRDVGSQLESSPEVIHVESMQHGIMELARAERGAAAPTIEVHTTTSGVHGVNARPEVDVSQKVEVAKRKSGLFANIFHKKDKKKEAAAVALPLIQSGHVHKPATAIAIQASTEDTPHVNLSIPPVRVVGQNGPGSIIANAEAPPPVVLLSPSADVIEAPFSPNDVTASAAFSVPTIGAAVESPEIDASLDETETRLGAEIQMEPPEVGGWRMATVEMNDGVSGEVLEPEAVDVSQSISSSAAVPYEPNVELETGNSVSPNPHSSFFTESLDTPATETSDAELSAERNLESSSVTVDLDPALIAPSLPTRERATERPLRVEVSSVAGTEQRSAGVEVLATVEQPAVGHAVKPASPASPTSPTSKEDKKSGSKVHHSWNPFKSRSSKKTDKSLSGVGTETDASAHRPQSRVGSTSPSVSLEGEVKLLPSGSPLGYESEKNLKHLGVEGKTTAVAASSVVDTPEVVVIGDVLSTVVVPLESEASRGTAMGSNSHPLHGDVNASQLEMAGDEFMESSIEKSIVSAEAGLPEPEHHPLRASTSEPAAHTSSKPAATAEIKSHKKGGAFGGLKNIFKSKSSRKSESDHQQGTSGNQLTTAATVGQTTHVGNGKQVNLETAGVVYSPSTHIGVDKSGDVPRKQNNPEIAAALGLLVSDVSGYADNGISSETTSDEDVPRKQNNPEIAAALELLVSDVSGYADNGISGETTSDIPRDLEIPRDQDIPRDQAAKPASSDERETFDVEHEELCPQLEEEDCRLLENGIHTTLASAAVDEPNSTGSRDDDSGKKTGSDDDFDAEYVKPYHALPELSPDSGEFEFALTSSGMDLSADAMLRTLGLRPMSVEEIANESKDFGDDDVSPDTNGNSDHVTKSSSSPTLWIHTDHDADYHRHSSARKFDNDQSSPDLLHDGLANFGRLERAPETTDLSRYELPSLNSSSDKPSPLASSDDEDSYERDLPPTSPPPPPPTSPPPPPPLDEPQPSEMKVKLANGRSHIPHDDDGNDDDDSGKSQRRGDLVLHAEERKPVKKRMAPIAGDLNNNETSLRTSLQSSPS